MAKSGSITIKLGPQEVKEILANPKRILRSGGYSYGGDKLPGKIYKAVAKKFPNPALDEEVRAWAIIYALRETEEWKTISDDNRAKVQRVHKVMGIVDGKGKARIEALIQAKLDEAGITQWKAWGYHIMMTEERR